MNKILLIVFLASPAFAETCPSEKLCPKLETTMSACHKNRTEKGCKDFLETFSRLFDRYDCKRTFDKQAVPAAWLCDEGVPSTNERACDLLSKLKFKKAKTVFGSEKFRTILDGELAENYLKKSIATGKHK